ncbi:nucleobase-ascorbate transporter 12 [Actinidia rufa]|uniref:Nucleobase-ascorbate transporter 12 n=1 Tax=Actinidia rufa TaxID=165716 RepID=A0A7J0GPK3_9ERIC|nr:nucleobase-ascorbate transporter 12 [Actinidia rufa]
MFPCSFVVAPTIAAVGLSFYSYGFPRVGTCLEIGAVQILLVIIFSLVPLGLAITWAAAFLLTEVGAYSYKGCDVNVPVSNIISEHCRKHISRMKQCRVDTSQALKSSPWFRFPYPLQWGTPVFNWKMALFMCVVSLISSVDSVGALKGNSMLVSHLLDALGFKMNLAKSELIQVGKGGMPHLWHLLLVVNLGFFQSLILVGSYHASSLLVASRPPTPGILSRGIGLEGLSGILAGLWGTGTGSTTLTENVHTIAVTKMGSRRAVELGACFLIVLSLVGKVGGFIASIPEVMSAALLCFMWAMLAALAYFQQYGISPNTNLSVPSYLQPYIVASHGPFRTKYGGLNYVMNTLLSLHMVIAFLIAVVLDNTVPGSPQERGVYVWSEAEAARREPAVAKDYGLPFRVGRVFRWVKWVGL